MHIFLIKEFSKKILYLVYLLTNCINQAFYDVAPCQRFLRASESGQYSNSSLRQITFEVLNIINVGTCSMRDAVPMLSYSLYARKTRVCTYLLCNLKKFRI